MTQDYNKNKLVSACNTRSRYENVMNLLLLQDGDQEHLIWIKDFKNINAWIVSAVNGKTKWTVDTMHESSSR